MKIPALSLYFPMPDRLISVHQNFPQDRIFLQKLLGLPRNGHKFKNLPLAHSHGAVKFSGLDLEGP